VIVLLDHDDGGDITILPSSLIISSRIRRSCVFFDVYLFFPMGSSIVKLAPSLEILSADQKRPLGIGPFLRVWAPSPRHRFLKLFLARAIPTINVRAFSRSCCFNFSYWAGLSFQSLPSYRFVFPRFLSISLGLRPIAAARLIMVFPPAMNLDPYFPLLTAGKHQSFSFSDSFVHIEARCPAYFRAFSSPFLSLVLVNSREPHPSPLCSFALVRLAAHAAVSRCPIAADFPPVLLRDCLLPGGGFP